MELRGYQQDSVLALRRSLSSGRKRPILVAPTGSGKTVLAQAVCKGAVEKGNRVLFLAPRRELIYQARGVFERVGLHCGTIMAGEPSDDFAPVQVASVDTLYARGVQRDRILLPNVDIVLVDEAHLAITAKWRRVYAAYPDIPYIGFTATPARGDGRGLGAVFDDLVQTVSVAELTAQGYLVPVCYYAPTKPQLDGLKCGAQGDYIIKGLNERMDRPQLVGDIVDNWQRIANGRSTVVFCVTRAHSRHVRDEFLSRGVAAEHLDGETPLDERKAILERVISGETTVLTNVYVATFGLDVPRLEVAVLARPTRNLTLYLQTAGRVLRPSPDTGKAEAVIIDHAGAVERHGFVDDNVPWTLSDKVRITDEREKQRQEQGEPKEIVCEACGTVFRRSRICPSCGHRMFEESEPIPYYEAHLEEVQRQERKANRTHTHEQKQAFFSGLVDIMEDRGYQAGWVKHKYREKFGVWPRGFQWLAYPNAEARNWVRHLNIAYHKAKESKERAA